MRRRSFAALVSTLFLLIATTGIIAGGTTMQTDPPASVSVIGDDPAPGNTTTVAVHINSSAEVYAAQFSLGIEPTTTEIVSSSRGSYLSQNGSSLVVANDINGSSVTYGETRIRSEHGVVGTGTVANISLTVPEDISRNISLTLTDVSLVDPSIESMPVHVENKTLTVRGVNNDSETATPPEPADDSQVSESNDNLSGDTELADSEASDSTNDNGDQSDSSSTTSDETASSAWQSKVDQRVIDVTDSMETSPVLIEIQSPRSTGLSQTAAQLNESGLQNASLNRDLQIVQGEVAADALPRVANVTGVERIRYDLSVEQQPTATGPSQSQDSETIVTESPEQMPTASIDANNERATSADGPGFSIIATLLSVALCIILVTRKDLI